MANHKTKTQERSAACKELFCKTLKELRNFRQFTQQDVAQGIGVAVSTYANWEQGRTEPGIGDIYNLLVFYDIKADELFDISSIQ